MTTKSYSAGSNAWDSTFYEEHTSTGTDGKYELVDGILREKWNDYDRNDYRYTRTKGAGRGTYPSSTQYPLPPDYMITEAQNKLVDKLRGHQFNLAVFAAEAGMTTRMIIDNLGALSNAVRDVRHGKFSDALRRLGTQFNANQILFHFKRPGRPNGLKTKVPRNLSLKDVSGRWLELQYGWLPLLQDVEEASRAYSALMGPHRIYKVKVVRKVKGGGNTSVSPTIYSINSDFTQKVYLRYEMKEVLSIQRSLGLDDPLSVVWEIIPYSFVIDWFIPLGAYFDNLSMIPKLTGRSILTRIVKQDSYFSGTENPSWFGASYNMTKHTMERRVTVGQMQAVLPSFKPLPAALSSKHIWNAIALAHQRIAR